MRDLCLALVIAILAVSPTLVKAQMDESLVLYFPFDDGSGKVAEDFSKYGNNGNLEGSPKWVAGKFGMALEFDGSADYVQVAHNKVFDFGDKQDFTIEFWMKSAEETGEVRIDKRIPAKTAGYLMWNDLASDHLRFRVNVGTAHTHDTNTDVTDKSWHHIAAYRIGSDIGVYIDGVSAGTLAASSDTIENDGDLFIGAKHTLDKFFAGVMDEFRIWNRALSENEIKDNMNKGKEQIPAATIPQDSLAATWAAIKAQD